MTLIVGFAKSSTRYSFARHLKLCGFFLFFATITYARSELNLAKENPSSTVIDSTEFPRTSKVLYRGTHEAQFPYIKAVKAMLEDPLAKLESPMYSTIKDILLGKSPALFQRIRGLQEEYASLGIRPVIENKMESKSRVADEETAMQITEDIMNSVYDISFARKNVYDYLSSTRNDFPTAFVYSTVYVETAKIYSPHIVIIKENKPRSLDANYWNRVHNGKWVHTNNAFPDRGEFIAPFYIPATDIIGYQHNRTGYSNIWYIWRALEADLGLVFMKTKKNNIPFVYIFDASGLQHVVEVEGQFCSAFTQFDPNSDIPKMARPDCLKRPRLIAVLRSCPSMDKGSKKCSVPKELFKNYEAASERYHSWLKNFAEINLSNGDPIKFFINDIQSSEGAENKSLPNEK